MTWKMNKVPWVLYYWDTAIGQILEYTVWSLYLFTSFTSLFMCSFVGLYGNCSSLRRLTDSSIIWTLWYRECKCIPQNICLWQQLHKYHTMLPKGLFHSSFFTLNWNEENKNKPDLTQIYLDSGLAWDKMEFFYFNCCVNML